MGDYRPAECWACPVQSRDIPLQWMHYSSASGSLKVVPEVLLRLRLRLVGGSSIGTSAVSSRSERRCAKLMHRRYLLGFTFPGWLRCLASIVIWRLPEALQAILRWATRLAFSLRCCVPLPAWSCFLSCELILLRSDHPACAARRGASSLSGRLQKKSGRLSNSP